LSKKGKFQIIFQKILEDSRRFEKILEDSRRFLQGKGLLFAILEVVNGADFLSNDSHSFGLEFPKAVNGDASWEKRGKLELDAGDLIPNAAGCWMLDAGCWRLSSVEGERKCKKVLFFFFFFFFSFPLR